MTLPYSYINLFRRIELEANEKQKNDFYIREADYEIWLKVLCYFTKDVELAAKLNINLNKGILLNGPIGCGKTTIFRVLNMLRYQEFVFKFVSARDMSFEFAQDGFQTINKYGKGHFNSKNVPCTLVIDDIGSEQEIKLYGNTCNVIKEVVLSRYDFFISHNMITHFTTNFNAEELDAMYGERFKSRLREMCNLISFPKATFDKRM